MPPTQKELAKFAGVSSGTVSNVISGAPGVSEQARQKVLAAVRALDYQPNLIARSLRTNRTFTLGMVVPDITVPFFPRVIRGAESAAREAGYFLSVLDSESSPARETAMMGLLRSQRVEGVLLVTAGGQPVLAENPTSSAAPTPLIYLDRLPIAMEVDSVCVDDMQAAEMAVAHLLEMGHTRIGIITGPLDFQNEQDRLLGYRQAFQKRAVPVSHPLIWKGSFDQVEVARLCSQKLSDPATRPTALFATNGVTGLAAIKSIYAMGLATPRDIACVTFDELSSEEFFRPGITSVVQPAFDIGSRAVEVLLKRIAEPRSSAIVEKVRLPASLVIRESSSRRVSDPW
jgi:DNA-binding LacI/PurR family transcriptional regulator